MTDNNYLKNFNFASLSKAQDLKNRLLFTVCVLFVYRIGTYIPIPGLDPHIISEIMQRNMKGILNMLDMFSGGSLSRMTVFALNLMPYITSSIIIQIMTFISPTLAALKKEGPSGRKKMTQYTRYLTIVISFVQAYGICIGMGYFSPNPVTIGKLFPVIGVPTLICGTFLMMWLGEQITSRGIGNGVSLLIFSGIVANLPNSIAKLLTMGKAGALSVSVLFFIVIMVFVVIGFVVFMEKSQRKVRVTYPNKRPQGAVPGAQDNTHLPLKLNSSGVIPPIFANSILLLPATVVSFLSNSGNGFVQALSRFLTFEHPVFLLLYALLIIFFSFFYTAIVFNSEETADNLKKSGGFIPGVRPGKHTAEYFDTILTRITVVGSLYLTLICIVPQFIMNKLSVPVYLNGTSILIVVSVGMDTVTQIYTRLISQQYEGLFKKYQKKVGGKK